MDYVDHPPIRTDVIGEDGRVRRTDEGLSTAWLGRLRQHAAELRAALPQPASVADKPPREQHGKRMTIDQRMKLVLFEKPESSGWSITEFETELKCSRAGIHKTASWKALEAARKLGKAERRNDRRAKTR